MTTRRQRAILKSLDGFGKITDDRARAREARAGDGMVSGTRAHDPGLEPAEGGRCLWCGQPFAVRRSGGSPQRFCGTRCRQAFWSAARRWVMAAVESGLLTADALKAPQTSVHAVAEAFQWRSTPNQQPPRCAGSPAPGVQPHLNRSE